MWEMRRGEAGDRWLLRCGVAHLFSGCKLVCLVEVFGPSPLLGPPLDLSGELWELTPHTAALHRDACLERGWRLLTWSAQDGKVEEEEKEEEGEVSVTLSKISSSSCHCIPDDVMWNFMGHSLGQTPLFFLHHNFHLVTLHLEGAADESIGWKTKS